jgi:small neutral amino acid transporter SnatA (MarC family)
MAFMDTSAAERGFGAIALTADTTQTINAAQTALTGKLCYIYEFIIALRSYFCANYIIRFFHNKSSFFF